MHPRIALAITRKDLVDAIRNMYLVIALVLPIAMSLLFRFLFSSGSDAGAGALDISIHDPGKSQLVQYLIDSKQFSLYFAGSGDEVADQIKGKDLLGGLVIPADFDAEVMAGTTPELHIYLNTQRGGLRLMERMVGFERAIVIDAICTGAAPGTIHRLSPDAVPTQHSASTHDLNLPTALALGRQAGALLPASEDILILGIEAVDVTTFGEDLTPAVEAAVPQAVQSVLSVLEADTGVTSPTSGGRE